MEQSCRLCEYVWRVLTHPFSLVERLQNASSFPQFIKKLVTISSLSYQNGLKSQYWIPGPELSSEPGRTDDPGPSLPLLTCRPPWPPYAWSPWVWAPSAWAAPAWKVCCRTMPAPGELCQSQTHLTVFVYMLFMVIHPSCSHHSPCTEYCAFPPEYVAAVTAVSNTW